jgi:predicted transcriptional regulator
MDGKATILLAVKPEYAERILSGVKRYEFRRRRPLKPVGRILIYATQPRCAVVGEAAVARTITESPEILWAMTARGAGIGEKAFMEYFAGSGQAHAFVLGDARKYKKPKQLSEFGLARAPQSFVYVHGYPKEG